MRPTLNIFNNIATNGKADVILAVNDSSGHAELHNVAQWARDSPERFS